ncbi:hypothetical protein [Aestuariivirga sp.]|uniref:hypothetical protein n=1 Tax=Aestuariivirga sp. TaxID=2650926 RepID=UPI0035941899
MADFAYIAFVLAFIVLGTLLGILAHFWRAHATIVAEDLGLGEPLNTFTRDDYQWEKHVVGAEWDDAGFWDPGSVRNLLYYMASGAFTPLLIGVALWGERAQLVTLACQSLAKLGLNSPLCF